LLLLATFTGAVLVYPYSPCRLPIYYSVGSVDSRFNTDNEEIQRMALRAEALWEDALDAELFVYDESASFAINLIYDERQHNATLEIELREDLVAKENMSESVFALYEELTTQFRSLRSQYETLTSEYDLALHSYNEKVKKWNAEGGAPKNELNALAQEEVELRAWYQSLETLSKRINTIVEELNMIGAHGNALVAEYNSVATEYNKRFSIGHEYAQGDYTQKEINIYQFNSEEELVLVLAHEFGHALGIGHIENSESIMYHIMNRQTITQGLTEEDVKAYALACEKRSLFSHLKRNIF